MSYESPIEIIQGQINTHVEDMIYQSCMKAGVTVDKDELLKALAYDRQQYQKGYDDRGREIVRCENCVNRGKADKCVLAFVAQQTDNPLFLLDDHGTCFCADGERRDDNA